MAPLREFLALTDEQREIQRLARDFAQTELAPHAAAWDRDAHFEASLVARLGALGFLGMLVPESYDGMALECGDVICWCSKRSPPSMHQRR